MFTGILLVTVFYLYYVLLIDGDTERRQRYETTSKPDLPNGAF